MKRALPALAILAALMLSAGCTTMSAGEPRPDDTTTASSDPGAPSGSGDLPPRPAEIPVDDVDPCTLIPQADESDFYIDEPGEPGKDNDGNTECLWAGTRVGFFGISLDVSEGAEVWINGTKNYQGELTDPILDFSTVTYQLDTIDNSCFVSVDVADGQQLIAHIGIDAPFLDQAPPVCEYAHQFAASAMSTLVES